MGHRESVLSSYGYGVRYEKVPKERGGPAWKRCIAARNGKEYFAFTICPLAGIEHFQRIISIQDSIPHMARLAGPIEDVVLLETARGRNLWEMDNASDYAAVVEGQLLEFAAGTKKNQLIHGDLRPWNVFFDLMHGVQVIDWWTLSAFVDDLVGDQPRRRDLIDETGHYATFYPDLAATRNFTDIDLRDAHLIGRLLRAELSLTGAWRKADKRSSYPVWCKHD